MSETPKSKIRIRHFIHDTGVRATFAFIVEDGVGEGMKKITWGMARYSPAHETAPYSRRGATSRALARLGAVGRLHKERDPKLPDPGPSLKGVFECNATEETLSTALIRVAISEGFLPRNWQPELNRFMNYTYTDKGLEYTKTRRIAPALLDDITTEEGHRQLRTVTVNGWQVTVNWDKGVPSEVTVQDVREGRDAFIFVQ